MNKTLVFVLFTVALTVPCHAEDVPMATASLQDMIDTAAGLVELPAGTHVIDAPLVVDLTKTGYRGIRGANGATRIVMTAPGPAIKIVGNHTGTAIPASVTEHTWEGERFPVVSGLEILGKHPEADGIELRRTIKCKIQNVLIRNCRYGVHYDSADQGGAVTLINARNIRVSDCQIIHPRFRGIHLINGIACVFSDNTIERAGEDFQAAIEVSGESKSNLVQQNLIIADAAKSITTQDNTGTRVGNTIVTGE